MNEATTVKSGCLKFVARFSLSKKAKKTTDRTKEILGEKKFDVKFQQGPPVARQALPFGKTFECESRNKIEEEIMASLRDVDVNMIGICGMGGLGKTTMAKKIRNRVLDEKVFEEVAMTTVTQQVDKSKIQVEIGEQLGLHLEDDGSDTRVQKLHKRLSSTKRTLLIFDDVWETLDLLDFGISCDSKGCTILLTSRNSDVMHAMEVQIFGMKVLSEQEAFSFLRDRAGTCVDDRELNPIAKEIAKECGGLPIALAVVGVGLKNERSASSWNNAKTELKQRVPDTVRFDIKNVYNPLKWSYNRLNSKSAQSLFLLCCLFPEDADIAMEYVTYFCMGLGMFEGIMNLEDARNKMCDLMKKLKDRSLLLESDKENCVRMHDVVRDVCISIAKEERCIGREGCTWISSSHLVGQRNQLLSGSRCPNLNLLFLDSRYADFSLGFKFDDAFVEGMRELNVLCIANYQSLTTLPHPTQSLGKLNTLILDSCEELETISVVGELVNLEILICRDCNSIEKLPSEMKGLNRLKLLEVRRCYGLQSIERGIISSLVGLEQLKIAWSFNRWEGEDREERENAGLRELEALNNLECLEIHIEDPSLVAENMPRLSKNIVRFIIRTNLRSVLPSKFNKAMSLRFERETRLGDWIEMQLLRDTECLELDGDGENNLDLAKSQNIRWLELYKCESMKSIARTSGDDDATVFALIEHLKLVRLPELQELCDGPVSSTSFQKLKVLVLNQLGALTQLWKSGRYVPHFSNLSSIEIWFCDSLRNLGQLSMAGKDCLPQLERLHVYRCRMMEQVFLWNNEEAGESKRSIESQGKRHAITKVFPKLKEVLLRTLPNLTTFYQGIQGIEFPLLTEMKIEECPKMKSLIESCSPDFDYVPHFSNLSSIYISDCDSLCNLGQLSMAGKDCLPQLERLHIYRCRMVEQVFLWNDEDAGKNKGSIESQGKGHVITMVFPKLKEVLLRVLPNLTTFYQGIQGIEFPLLTEMKIQACPKMKGIIGSSSANIDDSSHLFCQPQKVSFRSLEVLEITKYDSSMRVFTLSMAAALVSLREFSIANCAEMIKVIEDEQQVVSGGQRIILFPKLEILKLYYIPKLVTFSEWKCDVELPLLRKVDIGRCPKMESFIMELVATPNMEAFRTDLTTNIGVGVGVDVLFVCLKILEIQRTNESLYDKISESLFSGLEKLYFCYMGSMSVFSSSAVGNLVNLRVLNIRHSYEIVKVIGDEEEKEKEDGKVVISGCDIRSVVFPKLEELCLKDLPKLMRFNEWKCDVEFPSLTKVEIRSCHNMESFSMGFVAAPNLQIVEIDEEGIDATNGLNGALHQHYSARQQKEKGQEEEEEEEEEGKGIKEEKEIEEDDQN